MDVPVDDEFARRRVGEQHPQQVPTRRLEFDDARVQTGLRIVPPDEFPTWPEHVRRRRHQRIEEPNERARRFGRCVDGGSTGLGERQEVVEAGGIES